MKIKSERKRKEIVDDLEDVDLSGDETKLSKQQKKKIEAKADGEEFIISKEVGQLLAHLKKEHGLVGEELAESPKAAKQKQNKKIRIEPDAEAAPAFIEGDGEVVQVKKEKKKKKKERKESEDANETIQIETIESPSSDVQTKNEKKEKKKSKKRPIEEIENAIAEQIKIPKKKRAKIESGENEESVEEEGQEPEEKKIKKKKNKKEKKSAETAAGSEKVKAAQPKIKKESREIHGKWIVNASGQQAIMKLNTFQRIV